MHGRSNHVLIAAFLCTHFIHDHSSTAIGLAQPKPRSTNSLCSKCATHQNSGQLSCCFIGGAWFKQCGDPGSGSKHAWFEGIQACKDIDSFPADQQSQGLLDKKTTVAQQTHIDDQLTIAFVAANIRGGVAANSECYDEPTSLVVCTVLLIAQCTYAFM